MSEIVDIFVPLEVLDDSLKNVVAHALGWAETASASFASCAARLMPASSGGLATGCASRWRAQVRDWFSPGRGRHARRGPSLFHFHAW